MAASAYIYTSMIRVFLILHFISHTIGRSSTALQQYYSMSTIHFQEEALAHLHELLGGVYLPTWNSDGEEISKWLELVQGAIGYWNNNLDTGYCPITLHAQEIAFVDSRNRYQTLLRHHNANVAANADHPPSETQEEFFEKVESWGHMDRACVDH
jgi:hypothetical protein